MEVKAFSAHHEGDDPERPRLKGHHRQAPRRADLCLVRLFLYAASGGSRGGQPHLRGPRLGGGALRDLSNVEGQLDARQVRRPSLYDILRADPERGRSLCRC